MPQKKVDLKAHTTIRTSTVADTFSIANTRDELVELVQSAIQRNERFMVVGGGSNTVFGGQEFQGHIIKNQYLDLEVLDQTPEYTDIRVSSGLPVSMLIAKTNELGLEGFEYHQGLPGTVGGAIYMNSKWTNPIQYFGDHLRTATVIDKEGKEKTVDSAHFKFAYDYSALHETGDILVDCVFRLKKQDPTVLRQRSTAALEYRKQTQPFGVASSGCVFQNYDGKSAGKLIDECGLKGFRVGKFVVSEKHANFIVNEGDADVSHLIELINHVKDTVRKKTGVELREEIRIIQ